jgi:hypothetical protein
MMKIKRWEPEEEKLVIPPLQTTFLRYVEVIRYGMADLHVGTLECQDKEQIKEVKIKAENEMLS